MEIALKAGPVVGCFSRVVLELPRFSKLKMPARRYESYRQPDVVIGVARVSFKALSITGPSDTVGAAEEPLYLRWSKKATVQWRRIKFETVSRDRCNFIIGVELYQHDSARPDGPGQESVPEDVCSQPSLFSV